MELFADKPLGMKVLSFVMSWMFMVLVASAEAREFSVYSVSSTLPMGEPGEVKFQDYYVNMGSRHGLKKGDRLEALRRVPSYDMIDQEFSRDLLFPIAVLRILHIQSNAAICRVDRMLPARDRPTISPSSVMVGDYVRILGTHEYPSSFSQSEGGTGSLAEHQAPLQQETKGALEGVEKPKENTLPVSAVALPNPQAQPQARLAINPQDLSVSSRELTSIPAASTLSPSSN